MGRFPRAVLGARRRRAAYAANTVFSSDIVDGEVKIADVGRGAVGTSEVLDDTATGGGLAAADLRCDGNEA